MFDSYAPAFIDDPYPTFARLRAESPVFFDERWGLTFFTRHADIHGILRDRRFGRDVRHAVPRDEIDNDAFDRIYPQRYPMWTAFIRESFIDFEPPDHTRLRRLVQSAFNRRASESYRPRLEATATRLLDEALERGEMDAVADYAEPIPLAMIAELMGVPETDQPLLVNWSHRIVRLYDQACTDEEGDEAEEATAQFAEYTRAMVARRRSDPTDDLVSALAHAEVDGDRLTDDEVIATSILALNAGHEATVQAIGNGLLALARNPDEYRRLHADPGLMATALDELLRYDTPLQMFERWVLEDLDWNGTPLRRGTKVGLLFGSANHDGTVFADPEHLHLNRATNPHISFGGGIHYCVGAPLAKVELDVAFSHLSRRVASIELASEHLDRTPSLIFRGVRQLPLILQPLFS
jgi:unspecific monooxygenase